jgi:hypothetical protein
MKRLRDILDQLPRSNRTEGKKFASTRNIQSKTNPASLLRLDVHFIFFEGRVVYAPPPDNRRTFYLLGG